MINKKRNAEVAGIVGAEIKQCFRNAALASIVTGGTLVEGYAVSFRSRIPFEHAWIEEVVDGYSVITDPTIVEGCQIYEAKYRFASADVERYAVSGKSFPMCGHLHKGMTSESHLAMLNELMNRAKLE